MADKGDAPCEEQEAFRNILEILNGSNDTVVSYATVNKELIAKKDVDNDDGKNCIFYVLLHLIQWK